MSDLLKHELIINVKKCFKLKGSFLKYFQCQHRKCLRTKSKWKEKTENQDKITFLSDKKAGGAWNCQNYDYMGATGTYKYFN